VLANQGFGVVQGLGQRRQGGGTAPVAQRDGYVAQQAAALGAQERRAFEAGAKGGVVQRQQLS